MSLESAKAFYLRMTTDEAFRTQLEQAASKEERQQILQASSYEFTLEEWEATKAQFQASNSADSELSDVDLQAVSGGLLPILPILMPAYGGIVPLEPLFDTNDLLS